MDDVDHAQALASAFADKSIAAHRTRPSAPGRDDCVDCRQQISRERLQANPTAQRCTDCQQDFEGK